MSADRPRLLVLTQNEPPPDIERLRTLAEVTIGDESRLVAQLAEADIVYVWDFFWDRHTDALDLAWQGARPRWVHIANVGIEKLASPGLIESGAVVTNAVGVYERPIAEHVLTAYLALAKQVPLALRHQHSKTWHRLATQQIEGRRAVVVGAGPIGREIARLIGAVGMPVDLVGRSARTDEEFGAIHASTELRDLLPDAGLVVLVAPLTDETRGMLGPAELALLGEETILVNVGRGELVDEDALIDALRERRFGGAAIDVFAVEPLPASSPIWSLPNTLVTAHMAGTTTGWRDRLTGVFTANLEAWVAGDPLRNIVDPAELARVAAARPGPR